MSNWKKHKLGNLVKFQRGHDLSKSEFIDGNIPIVGSNGIIGHHNKFTCKAPCITIGRSGSLGTPYFYNVNIWAHNTTLYVKEFYNCDPKFMYYLLQTIDFKQFNSGSAVPSLNRNYIHPIEVLAPEIQEQQRIASILSSLDDKIELNRQTNQTLEGIAQTLFQEMCVPKGEELPEGWKVGKLSEIIKIKHGYAFKGEFFSDVETEDILITPGNFKIGGGFNYSKFKYYNGDIPKDYILTENDLIVTMTDLSKEGDTLGYSALVPTIQNKQLLHNQRVGKIEYKGGKHLKFFLYFSMREKNYRNFVLGSATGTTVRHTSPDRICDFNLAIPNDKTIIKFSDIVKPMLDNILSNEQENQTLIALRDSLLPKLMKGEIEI